MNVKQDIEYMANDRFSTEIREVYEKPYIKVFFLNDNDVDQVKNVLETLNCVKKVNITISKSESHPGQTLTVYPKPMVDANTCEKEVVDTLEYYFSNVTKGKMVGHSDAHFADIEKKILDALDKAEASIDVCVAWLTNEKLRDKLLEKKKKGVKVRVITYKDGVNHNKGVDLTGLSFKEYRGERGGLMHDKFCVIDNVHTINGSYNWTSNAEHKNDEDASFRREDYIFASNFTKRFNQMWERDGKED